MVNKDNAKKWEKFTEEVQSTNDVPAKNENAKESLTKEQFNQFIVQELFDPKCIK